MEGAMRILEASRLTGVSPDTIRRWEKIGLIKIQRDWAGHRRFALEDVATLRRLAQGGASGGKG